MLNNLEAARVTDRLEEDLGSSANKERELKACEAEKWIYCYKENCWEHQGEKEIERWYPRDLIGKVRYNKNFRRGQLFNWFSHDELSRTDCADEGNCAVYWGDKLRSVPINQEHG